MNIISIIDKLMSYSIDSSEQENNSLTNIWFGTIQVQIQMPNRTRHRFDS